MFNSQTQDGYSINIPTSFHDYKITKYIGCGSSCIVVLVVDTKTNFKYAAKIISIADVEDKNMKKSIKREIDIISRLNHPNIIKIQESFKLTTNEDEYYVIIMEYCENGDLLAHAIKHMFKSEYEKKKIIYDVLDAIRYLHENGISHGDIKSENILLDSQNSPKLCDFGFCSTSSVLGNDSKNGTLYYAAPELFAKGKYDPKKSDIWAIGITIYSIFELQFPFKDGKQSYIVKQIMSGKLSIDKKLNQKVKQIVEKCTNSSPQKRPTVNEIMQSDYFSEFNHHQVPILQNDSKNNNSFLFRKVPNQLPKMLSNSSDEPEEIESILV